MRLLFTALACLISVSVLGQGWEQTFNLPISSGQGVLETADGGYIITGTIPDTYNEYDIYLLKTDANGDLLWIETYGTDLGEKAYDVKQTSDGGYIIAGSVTAQPGGSYSYYLLIKTDEYGIEEWSQIIEDYGGYFQANTVDQTSDGGYVFSGSGGELNSNKIYKTDSEGQEEWSFNRDDPGWARSVQQTNDGGYIVAWHDYDNDLGGILKLYFNGTEEWFQSYYASGNDDYQIVLESKSVQQTSDDGYVLTGICGEDFWNNGKLCIVKTDSYGNEQWSQTYFVDEEDLILEEQHGQGNCIKQTIDGGYVVCGTIADKFGVLKTDSNGIEEWSYTYGDNGVGFWGQANSIQQTVDGGFIAVGTIQTYSGNPNEFVLYLIKIDSEGTLSSSLTIPTPTPKKLEKVVDALGREVNHTTNQILFHIYDDGSVEKKFIVE